ncbi:thiamine diphosphokinase [Pseudodonghicola flavimaris]|uniref:Thiamine diphosphokinase n=1 Tax=Pseudodonghicola flavimaris TaxID=3050036 RepID=A0ABT7EUX6_9RHOB|nr:thiamine diphosphokinase [Pseudodonghicola flavimaris]MDK3016100.1 thiamine diphosphokinase [Pseudodonghicola flavimaris]
MTSAIVQSETPVTLIGGGALGPSDLETALALAPVLVAADGGADAALAAGRMPQAVIGDFDSLSARARAGIPADRLFPIREQESTDFDKALRSVAAPLVLAVGFLGDRVDHQLAAFNVLTRHAHRACILIGVHEVIFHAPRRLVLDMAAGQVVSLFPMGRVTGRSEGLEWPIDGLVLTPDGQIGTSNRALGPVTLETDGPGLLAILPRDRLEALIVALRPGS